MAIESVAVTGGSGKIGSAAIRILNERGYRTINLDRVTPEVIEADAFVDVDLVDAGETWAALAEWDVQAVIHLGTITHPRSDPGHVVFESNAMSSYHVLATAAGLDLEAVVLASSINAMGWSYQETAPDVEYLPIDEAHPVSPRDPYALGKYVIEVLSDGFARLPGSPARLASIRYPGVRSESQLRDMAADPRTLEDLERAAAGPHNPSGAYISAKDAGSICVEAIEADFEGHEVFWATGADVSVDATAMDVAATLYPEADRRRELRGTESVFDCSKAGELLGWEPQNTWRDRATD